MPERKTPQVRFKGFTDTWEQRKLGELATFTKGAGYSKSDLKETGTPVVLYGRLYTKYETVIHDVDTFADAKDGSIYSRGGEVVVPASGETAEDIAIASALEKSGILIGGDLNIIHPCNRLEPVFLAISISNGEPHVDMARRAQGKSVVHLHNEDLSRIELQYPEIEEQQKISQCFLNLDHLITLHQREGERLQMVKKSMLENCFPKNGEKVPRFRFAGFTGDWEQRKLSEVTTEFNSGEGIKADEIEENGTYPVYGGNGLRGYTERYNHDGEYALIGRQGALCGNMNYSVGKAYFTEHAVAVKANESNDTRFLYYLLDRMDLGRYSDQSAQPGLAVNKLIVLHTYVPRKQEQEAIGVCFKSLDSLITLHQSELEMLKKIKESMLGKMLV